MPHGRGPGPDVCIARAAGVNYDVRNACLGFLNGMSIAAMMIGTSAR